MNLPYWVTKIELLSIYSKRPKIAFNVIKIFQIQSIYSENAYGAGNKLRTDRQPGGCRPLILQQRGFEVLFEDAFCGKSR